LHLDHESALVYDVNKSLGDSYVPEDDSLIHHAEQIWQGQHSK
jgi:hypothetical protein